MFEKEMPVTLMNSTRFAAVLATGLLLAFDGAHADSLTLKSDRVASGGSTSATLTLDRAPTATAVYNVALSGTNAAKAQSRLDVGAGQSRVEFPVTTAPAGIEQFVDILVTEAASGKVAGRTRLVVSPPALQAFSLNKSSVVGGTPGSAVTGTVTLDGQAPVHGLAVPLGLSCSNQSCPAEAWLFPASVVIPSGSRSATFNFQPPTLRGGAAQATIIASLGSTAKSATLVNDVLRPLSLLVSPATISGAQATTVTLTLNAPAYANYNVRLFCSIVLSSTASGNKPCHPINELLHTMPAGQSAATFQLSNTQPLSAPASVTVRASDVNGNGSAQATLTVAP
jgi:hypothetical protein